MSWTDDELDELFRNAASDQYFRYKSDYFKDIEAQLPVRKRRGGLLWWTSGTASILAFCVIILTPENVEFKHGKEVSHRTYTKNSSSGSEVASTVSDIGSAELNISEGELQVSDKFENNNGSEVFKAVPLITTEPTKLDIDILAGPSISQPIVNEEEIGKLKIHPVEGFHKLDLVERSFYQKKSRQNGVSLFAEAGLGIGQSPIVNTEAGSSMSPQYGLSAGLLYQTGNFRFSGGLGISRRHFDNVYIKERSVIYGFGVNNYDNQYQFNSLVSMDIPLRVGYRFGQHILEAGFTTSVNLMTTVRYQESVDGQIQREGAGVAAVDLFSRINLRPELRYSFLMNNNWELGAALSVQAGSGISSDRFKGEINQLPLSGSVILRRTFDLR